MDTMIKATCPTCGEVCLTPDQMVVHVDHAAGRSRYTFTCPDCGADVSKPADSRIVGLLACGGVEVRTLAEPTGLARPFAGPAVCHDDLLDLHFALADDTQVAQVLQRLAVDAGLG